MIYVRSLEGIANPHASMAPDGKALQKFGSCPSLQYICSCHEGFSRFVVMDTFTPATPAAERTQSLDSMNVFIANIPHHDGMQLAVGKLQRHLKLDMMPRVVEYMWQEPNTPEQSWHKDCAGANINVIVYLTDNHVPTQFLGGDQHLLTVAGDVVFFRSNRFHRGPRNDTNKPRLVLFVSFGPYDCSGGPILLPDPANIF
jgi:hypothetical protein